MTHLQRRLRVSAYSSTYVTHARKEAVGQDICEHRCRTYASTHAISEHNMLSKRLERENLTNTLKATRIIL